MEESGKKGWTTAIVLICLAATLSSLSQVFWKLGDFSSLKGIILLIVGLLISGAGMVLMMISFRFGEVSILQPMMSIGFALSIVFGSVFFAETITINKVIGTGLIVIGAALLNTEGKKGEQS